MPGLSTDAAPSWLARFESLGANCEFGFVLDKCGIGGSALFRWSQVFCLRTVATLIERDFEGMYRWENLAPFNRQMVLDRGAGMAWHSLIKSERVDGETPSDGPRFRFVLGEAERWRIWATERKRMEFLAGKMRAELAAGGRIYVHRLSDQDAWSEEAVGAVFAAINRTARNHLLVVTQAGAGDDAETLEVLRPGLMHGRVDRFAPGDRADDVSLRSWLLVCRAALAAAEAWPAKA